MTEIEAIKMMEIQKPAYGCKEYKKPLMNAYEMAISALKKQIPKKPIIGTNMMLKNKETFCPCCGWAFPESLLFLKTRCWNCGQTIDWSEEDGKE